MYAPETLWGRYPLQRWGAYLVPGKILLVEDRADIRGMMVSYLTLNKYEVIEAVDGFEAVEKAIKHKPDAILMDIAMPVLDGIDSTRAMRKNKELAGIPILCLTASIDTYEERAKKAGCNEILQKPVDFGKLDAFLERYVH